MENDNFSSHNHICIEWKIRNISKVSGRLYSLPFPYQKMRVSLSFDVQIFKRVVVSMHSMFQEEGKHKVSLSLLDANEMPIIKGSSDWNPMTLNSLCIDGEFPPPSQRESILPDNLVKVRCVIDSIGECLEKISTKDSTTKNDPSLEILSSDLHKLLDNGQQSDIILNSCDQKFQLHKNILSARSEVFSAMFRNNLSETKEGVVYITDISTTVLKLLLQYIYSGKIEGLTWDNAPEVYAAADKYAVESLKQKCALFFTDHIKIDNVSDILYLSDLHNDQDLKSAVKLFIRNNKKSLHTEQWKKFSKDHPLIAVEVYEEFI